MMQITESDSNEKTGCWYFSDKDFQNSYKIIENLKKGKNLPSYIFICYKHVLKFLCHLDLLLTRNKANIFSGTERHCSSFYFFLLNFKNSYKIIENSKNCKTLSSYEFMSQDHVVKVLSHLSSWFVFNKSDIQRDSRCKTVFCYQFFLSFFTEL